MSRKLVFVRLTLFLFHQTSLAGPVNGVWGLWSSWSECSKSCDGGEKSRYRECDQPAPACNGDDCEGTRQDLDACNEISCECEGMPFSFISWASLILHLFLTYNIELHIDITLRSPPFMVEGASVAGHCFH